MNVLPVLVDLSPPPKLDLPTHGIGSSAGGFARILDQRLSATGASARFGQGVSAAPSAPYVSPTQQDPKPIQHSAPRNAEQAAHTDPSSSSAAHSEPPKNEQQTSATKERNTSAGQDSATGHNGASKSEANAGKPTDKGSKSSDSSAVSGGHHPKKEAASSTADKAKQAKASQTEKKKQPNSGKATSGVPFPGALILAGEHKVAAKAGTQATPKGTKVVEKLDLAKNLVNGSKTSEKAKPGAPVEAPVKKSDKTAAKNTPANAKELAGNGPVPPQLLATPLTTNPVTPEAMAAVHTAPGQPNAQQDPGAVAGHNGTTNQSAAVTIVDLRQNNQNNSSSTGQNGSQSHSNDGGNVRLFQLVDGGVAGSMKMNGQAGMARAAGAPAAGQSFSAFTDQIVKQTGILLKNNNSGEIRLVLKPEKLGNLRIKLDFNNNSLSGKILVQNQEALKLVQQNLDSLYRALRDSGFTATQLNVSVGGRDHGEKSRERSSPLPSARAIGSVRGFDNQAPALETAGSYYSLVNLMI